MTRPRKGTEEHVPLLEITIGDAMPKGAELKNDPQGVTARRRDIAVDRLIGMYRKAKQAGALDQLDPRVREYCEALIAQNGGKMPCGKGGRPVKGHQELLIWDKVDRAVKDGRGVLAAMRQVATDMCLTYEHVVKTYYRVGKDNVLVKRQRQIR